MTRTVVLEHALPGGSAHFDWMIETPDRNEERRLATWRLPRWPGESAGFTGERIGDHRAAYLAYEGEISGGRGRVRRVASGEVERLRLTPDALAATIRWDGEAAPTRYAGRMQPGGEWQFRVV